MAKSIENVVPRPITENRRVETQHGRMRVHHDYSHLLAPVHRKNGYRLYASTKRFPDGVHNISVITLHHKGRSVGNVQLYTHEGGPNKDLKEKPINLHSYLGSGHRGKGLGFRMYEAAISHGRHNLGATHVEGGTHTEDAHRVHQRLREKYGMQYKAYRYADEQYGDYHYAIKSEPDSIAEFVDAAARLKALKRAT